MMKRQPAHNIDRDRITDRAFLTIFNSIEAHRLGTRIPRVTLANCNIASIRGCGCRDGFTPA